MEQAVALLLCSIGCLATQTTETGCTPGEVRLVGGDHYEGRVEYCSALRVIDDPVWRPVCDTNQWTDFEAELACNATGLPGIINAIAQSCMPPRMYSSSDSALQFECDKTATSLKTCRIATLYPCNSAMATCIVENSCENCSNNSMCNEDFDPSNCQPMCLCDEGGTGKTCETEYTTPAPCDSSFCLNGGTCLHPDHNCTCPENWTGQRCEQRLRHSSNIVVIAISVAAVLLAVLVVISLLIPMAVTFGRRRKRKSRERAYDEMNTIPATRNTTENSTNEVTTDTATHDVGSPPKENSNNIMPTEQNQANADTTALGPRYPQGMYDVIKLEDSLGITSEHETRKQPIVFVNNSSEPKSEHTLQTGYSQLNSTYSHLNRDYRRIRFPRNQRESTQPLVIQCTSDKQYPEASYDEVYSPKRNTCCATNESAQYEEVGPPVTDSAMKPPMAEYDEVDLPINEYDKTYMPTMVETHSSPLLDEYGKLSSESKLPQSRLPTSIHEYEYDLPPMVDPSSPLMQYNEQINPVTEYGRPHCGGPSLPNQPTAAASDKLHSPQKQPEAEYDHTSDHSHGQQLTAMYEEPQLLTKYDAKLHKEKTSMLNSEDAKTSHDNFFSAAKEAQNPVMEQQQNKTSTGAHITSIDGVEYSVLGVENITPSHKMEEYSALNWETAEVEELAPEDGLEDQLTQNLEAEVLDPAGGPLIPTLLQRTESSGSSPSQAVCTQQGGSSPEKKGAADNEQTSTMTDNVKGNGTCSENEVQNQLAYSHMRHL